MTHTEYAADVALFAPLRACGYEQIQVINALDGLAARGCAVLLVDSTRPETSKQSARISARIVEHIAQGHALLAQPQSAYRVQTAMAMLPSQSRPYDALGTTVVANGSVLVGDRTFNDNGVVDGAAALSRLSEISEATLTQAALALTDRSQRERFESAGIFVLPGTWLFAALSERIKTPRDGLLDGQRIRVGRHIVGDERQWPDDEERVLLALPHTGRWDVRVYGPHRRLMATVSSVPRSWSLHHVLGPRDLASLDFWVPVEEAPEEAPSDPAIHEAIAAGLVVVLPRQLAGVYGGGALYSTTEGLRGLLKRLHNDEEAYRAQSERAIRFATQYAAERVVDRLKDVGLNDVVPDGALVAPSKEPRSPRNGRNAFRVLFVTSNGSGMGHLTRLLGIARAVRQDMEIIFVSLSQATPIVARYGFPFVYIASATESGLKPSQWNVYARRRFSEEISALQPDGIVFDGTWIYSGLAQAVGAAGLPLIWSRRGMWKEEVSDRSIVNAAGVAGIIEPGEVAAEFDRGATTRFDDAHRTPPITIINRHELLGREAARAELGLNEGEKAALVTLGAGKLGAIDETVSHFVAAFEDLAPDWRLFLTSNPIAGGVKAFASAESISRYPIAELAAAFEVTVSACGYNSYHEWMMAGVPSIWVPVVTQTDDQEGRARYADQAGLGVSVCDPRPTTIRAAVTRIVDNAEREKMRTAMRAAFFDNGADEAGHQIRKLLKGTH